METRSFQADAQQILRLVTHSIYSDREIFLRELLSNASDALDKARFLGVQNDDNRKVEGEAGIRVTLNSEDNTLVIEDDGVGMSEAEIVENLGTIAQSGTKKFLEKIEQEGELDSLIGQFGVGFYSAFMVADRVTVESLSIKPAEKAVKWESEGGESYSIGECEKASRGTKITLYLSETGQEFCDEAKLRGIIQNHSDFIQWPINLGEERINQETALWLRNPAEIEEEEYHAFYKHITKDWQEPLCYIHIRAEGTLQFNAILFVPKRHSYQLDNLNYKVNLKLYQKRVKVLDNANDLLPKNLRFVAGVVDSPDVNLNISREILQQTQVVKAIKKQLTKKILRKLVDVAKEVPEDYNNFWSDMGYMLKEGIPDDDKHKKDLLTLLRCKTTKSDNALRSLAEIKEAMQEGQEDIWYLTDVNKEQIHRRPILEGFAKRDWEVLLLSDPVDEWVVMTVKDFDETSLKSVSHGELPEDEEKEEETQEEKQVQPLVDWLNTLLEEDVSSVRMSKRLTNSPSVLVNQEGSMGANMENILKAANQEISESKRVLEINPSHPMVKTLAKLNGEGKPGLEPFAHLLLDHASIVEGKLDDPVGFANRLQSLMEKAALGM